MNTLKVEAKQYRAEHMTAVFFGMFIYKTYHLY